MKPAQGPDDTTVLGLACPLNQGGKCLLFAHRPLRCRQDGLPEPAIPPDVLRDELDGLSRKVFGVSTDAEFDAGVLKFTVAETVSGRFVQSYFDYLAGLPRGGRGSQFRPDSAI